MDFVQTCLLDDFVDGFFDWLEPRESQLCLSNGGKAQGTRLHPLTFKRLEVLGPVQGSRRVSMWHRADWNAGGPNQEALATMSWARLLPALTESFQLGVAAQDGSWMRGQTSLLSMISTAVDELSVSSLRCKRHSRPWKPSWLRAYLVTRSRWRTKSSALRNVGSDYKIGKKVPPEVPSGRRAGAPPQPKEGKGPTPIT
jgi:hypothetical protein